jgi:hypothetical protein
MRVRHGVRWNQFHPLSFCPYPLKRGRQLSSAGRQATGSHFIPYPFALILFKSETRARLFAFFSLSALIIPQSF